MPRGDDLTISIELDVQGDDRLRSWLLAEPAKLLRVVDETVREGTDIIGMTARPLTPVRTGFLQASQSQRVSESPLGAVGVVSFGARYARYVEHGTLQHGPAQRYALHTAEVSRPVIDALFDYKIRSAL